MHFSYVQFFSLDIYLYELCLFDLSFGVDNDLEQITFW